MLRLLYLIYFITATGLVVCSLSRLLFGWGRIPTRLVEFCKNVGVSVVWPFALCSKGGRKMFDNLLTKLF